MDSIVDSILAQCASSGTTVSAAFAGHVLRCHLESSPAGHEAVTPASAQELVKAVAAKLVVRDDAALETQKLQVVFDAAYARKLHTQTRASEARAAKGAEAVRAIVATRVSSSSDFETLTILYRRIYDFVLQFCPRDLVSDARAGEREVATALESVFPRIGLKAFVHVRPDDKRAQLDEMALVILGIRLFNQEIGKGGASLAAIGGDADSAGLEDELRTEIATIDQLCSRYQHTLAYCHLLSPAGVTGAMCDRWKHELVNRRQYLSCLSTVLEDLLLSAKKMQSLTDAYKSEVKQLHGLIGSRSSVPKEQVYPKFSRLAVSWLAYQEHSGVFSSTSAILDEVREFRISFTTTLTEDHPVCVAACKPGQSWVDDGPAAATGAGGGGGGGAAAGSPEAAAAAGEGGSGGAPGTAESTAPTLAAEAAAGADLLSIQATPDFMHLPLKYQGFCPWTLVTRAGLVVPGKPSEGVVRWENSYYVCAHAGAVAAFMADPVRYTSDVVAMARARPELIHLLGLQDAFPNIAKASPSSDPAQTGAVENPGGSVDSSTSTPLHFYEKNMDVKHTWNEWHMRQNALRITAIKKSKTTSSQTEKSHWKRDAAQHTYASATVGTNTGRDQGTGM